MAEETHEIPEEKLRTVCKIGQGAACCRYILAGSDGITCGKLVPEARVQLDRKVAAGLFTAISDNCEGI